jgi:DNA-binding beta-propeller fold protein YncE
MKTSVSIVTAVLTGLAAGVLPMINCAFAQNAKPPKPPKPHAPLVLTARIPLPGVVGRMDHFTVDPKHNRVIVCGLGSDTVEVVGMFGQRQIQSIKGQDGPQGLVYIPEFDELVVANDNGKVNIYKGDSYELLKTLDFEDGADNVRYDAGAKRVYVGYGEGAIGMIDPKTNSRLEGDFKLEEHPESFQLEANGPRIFVNLPVASAVGVIDRSTGKTTKWEYSGAKTNFAMQLDESNHRLFVNFRQPSQVVVFDTDSGKVVATMPSVVDVDDMYYDAPRKRLYVVGGEGLIQVVQQSDPNHYQEVTRIRTYVGGRTSSWFASRPRTGLIVAIPANSVQAAELWLYTVQQR